jgi:hypothetical protein
VVTLQGHHSERGVLVVVGTRRSVQPSTRNASYFVYDQARDEEFIDRVLVPRLGIPELRTGDLVVASQAQLGATARAAAGGMRVYRVDTDEAVPMVAYAGFAHELVL